MHLKSILNCVEPLKSFVYKEQRLVEVPGGQPFLEVDIEPRANGRPVCSGCGKKRSRYDRLASRRFEFVPLWNMAVFFVYAMRRVDCPSCGVTVERVPWATGKGHLTTSYRWFLARTLAGEIRPTQAAAFPLLAINIECQDPAAFPCLPHYEAVTRLRATYEQCPPTGPAPHGTVLSTSIVLGFPYADVPEMGSSAIVVINDDLAAACRHADALGDGLWQARDTFRPALTSIDAALDRVASLAGPICLLDMGDNVGGGSPADGMAIARAILQRGIPASFLCVCDPEAAARAVAVGAGARLRLAVGGHAPEWAGDPESQSIEADWHVKSVGDGRFTESRPRHGGATSFDQGPTAVLEHDRGLTVMVTTRRMAPFSLEQIRHAGLDPGSFRLLVAKGVHAPVAAYGEVCREFIRVNTPGVTTADLSRLHYRHRRRLGSV